MKLAILYSIKIWLTSVVLSPVVFVFGDDLIHPNNSEWFYSALGFIGFSIVYGLVLSIPCVIILFLFAGSLVYRKLDMIYKKLLLSIVGIVLSILPFYLLFRGDDNRFDLYTFFWSLSYCFFIVAGVWFYELEPAYKAKAIEKNL